MNSVWRDYQCKVDEVNLYFEHITSSAFSDDDVFKIMKANAFLMLYNLIESTVRNALEEIHNSISTENVPYANCIDELKALWIEFQYKKFKEKSSSTIISDLSAIGFDIISISYSDFVKNKSNDISGNLDRRKIEMLADRYKFNKNRWIHGQELFTIKTRRNSLAHGETSFLEVGRAFDISDLKKIKRVAILYLKEMLIYIERYLNNKDYVTT